MKDYLEITLFNDDGDEEQHRLPGKIIVCDTCHGKGSRVNPSVDGHGISPEEFDEDPDFREDYFAGRYDVTCSECEGHGRVVVPDEERCDAKVLERYWKQQHDLHECDRISEMERRMGA